MNGSLKNHWSSWSLVATTGFALMSFLATPASAAEFEKLTRDDCATRGIGGHTQNIALEDRGKLYANPLAPLKDFTYFLKNTGNESCVMIGARSAVWLGYWFSSDTHESLTLGPGEIGPITFKFTNGPRLELVQKYLDILNAGSLLNCHTLFDICISSTDSYGTSAATSLDGEVGKDLAMSVNSVLTPVTTTSSSSTTTTTSTSTSSTPSTSTVVASGSADHDPVAAKAASLDINGDKDLQYMGVTPLCVSGSLMKLVTSTTVNYCGADGKRYIFPNEKTYFTWYPNFSGIITVSAAQMGSIPIGGNVTYRPGTKLLKVTTDPKIYAVEKNGLLRYLPTAEIATLFYGKNWLSLVEDLPDPFFVNYRRGADVTIR